MHYVERKLDEEAASEDSLTPLRIKRLFKGHSHEQGERAIDTQSRKLYFLDTDLYRQGPCVMHSHQMSAQVNDSATVYMRPYGNEAFETKDTIPNSTI